MLDFNGQNNNFELHYLYIEQYYEHNLQEYEEDKKKDDDNDDRGVIVIDIL